jgi:hypothetical protein
MWFAFDLVDEGRISADSLVKALRQQMRRRRPIGQLAIEHALMTTTQVLEVLAQQANSDLPFGELAVELGFLTRENISQLILRQIELLPSIDDMLVQTGAISRRDLEAACDKLRTRLGIYRERQYEVLMEETTGE